MTSELQKRKQLVDLDSLISGSDELYKAGKMCRKCFYTYEKVFNAKTVLQINAAMALDAILPTHTGGPHACTGKQPVAFKYCISNVVIKFGSVAMAG